MDGMLPQDAEPVFVLKAKDALALPTIREYHLRCCDHGLFDQATEVRKAIAEMQRWQKENCELVKFPDHEHVDV